MALETTFSFMQREDVVRRALGQTPAPAGAEKRWILPTTVLVASLQAPSTNAKTKEVICAAAKFLAFIDRPGSAPDFQYAINMSNNFVILEPLAKPRGKIHFSCSCGGFARLAGCDHSLAMGIQDRLFEIPADRSFASLGKKKRGKGRIAKAAPALCRQPPDAASQHIGRGFSSSQAADAACFLCGDTKTTRKNQIVFCDGCDCGYHQKCVNLKAIPEGEWFCSPECQHIRDAYAARAAR